MTYRRVHIRVPIDGTARLSCLQLSGVEARAIDISHGGVAVSEVSVEELPETTYDIEVILKDGRKISLTAAPVRRTETMAAFKAAEIDQQSNEIIRELVFSYQESDDFIKQLEEHNLLDNYLVDESGNEIEISFSVDPEET